MKHLFILPFFFFVCKISIAQSLDSSIGSYQADTTLFDSLKPAMPGAQPAASLVLLDSVLRKNYLINSSSKKNELQTFSVKRTTDKNFLFYALVATALFFALLKTFYDGYLKNLFRVFFNTSLRQSQLTDQLLQAKLPSLLFNLFFVFTGGFYIFLLIKYLGYTLSNNALVLFTCMLIILAVYVVKYLIIKFTGWLSGQANAADTYIFIIFLINKIVAIALLPVIFIMAFSENKLVKIALFFSYFLIALMFLLRYFRAFSILQNKIKVQRLHFFLYIFGVEVLPLLLIYKTSQLLLINSL
ncbi:MAG: DUF4271 domain-containing protein [Ferruginibacter sp.]